MTAFRGRNYLLPTLLSMEAAGIAADDGTPQTGIDEGEDANEGPPAEDLARGALEDRRVRDLMRELEEASRDVRESDRPLSPAVASGDEAAGAVEGGLLVRRRGRVVRLEGGRLAFAFDQDPQGRALPPMVMLPNVVLERMEAVARSSEREPPMVVSGRVHLYRGVPHLLVQAYALERGEQLRPMQ